jgi:hypothetical protein
MPRPKSLKPQHCHHKPTRQGYVRLGSGSKPLYTGPWGSQQAQDEYDRLIGEWIATGRKAVPVTDKPSGASPPAKASTSSGKGPTRTWTCSQCDRTVASVAAPAACPGCGRGNKTGDLFTSDF